jgi:hypothetical protein
MPTVVRFLGLMFLTVAVVTQPIAAQPVSLVAWTQLGPNGTTIVRAVTSAGCPTGTVGGQTRSMAVRAPAGNGFPVTACETVVGSARTAFAMAGAPARKAVVRKIVVVGDTGCRIKQLKNHVELQPCNDPAQWPWATVAASAAAWGPDLVIHVGDLLYREVACPAGQRGCANSPSGYNWQTNNADFFAPAKPLLAAAPWIFVRGDHEGCARNGVAWFSFFEPRPNAGSCQTYPSPYAVPLGSLRLVVMDSSNADDETANPSQVVVYARQLASARQLAGSSAWLLTHKPVWGIIKISKKKGVVTDNPTLAAAVGPTTPAAFQMVLSGHIHFFQVLVYASRPPQFVVGNSGTLRIPVPKGSLPGLQVSGGAVAAGRVLEPFGFLTLEATAGGWQAVARDVNGKPLLQCTLKGRALACPSQ